MPDIDLELVAATGLQGNDLMVVRRGTGPYSAELVRPLAGGTHAPMKLAAGSVVGNGTNGTNLTTQAQVADRTVIGVFTPNRDMVLDGLGISISTAVAAALLDIIIYEPDADGRPSTVLFESASIDASTTGTKFVTQAITLRAGRPYWMGVRSNSTATIRVLPAGSSTIFAMSTAATPATLTTLIKTEAFAGAAVPWVYAASQHSNIAVPLILMRFAA